MDIFPNPTDGELTIKLEGIHNCIELKIFSIDGGLVQQDSFSNKEKLQVNLVGDSGIYLLEIKTEKSYRFIRILKK